MDWFIPVAARLVRAVHKAYARKGVFLGLFLCVFAVSTLALARLDLLPTMASASVAAVVDAPSTVTQVPHVTLPEAAEVPVKISIAKIGLSASIKNPTATEVNVLDAALLSGAVRYPTSAKLGEDGNVILFGHSSYLPIVNNQAYKTFNGIEKLKEGDVITVYSSDVVYTYAVETVTKESADGAAIPLLVSGRLLTLSTCDSFGKKSDRFVVVASFVESHVISG